MVPCGFQFVHTMGHGFATSATLGNLPCQVFLTWDHRDNRWEYEWSQIEESNKGTFRKKSNWRSRQGTILACG